uniref:Uncharacterized protein n=1 Tax=Anguilla anguilla TaxID=7936 RepID=A0A0E9QJD0_ANGAN
MSFIIYNVWARKNVLQYQSKSTFIFSAHVDHHRFIPYVGRFCQICQLSMLPG